MFSTGGDRVHRVTIKDGKVIVEREDGVTQTVAIDRFVPGAMNTFRDILFGGGILLVLLIVGRPIAKAIARAIDRRSVAPHVPRELVDRLQHMESALESVALEVERIGESQRFAARLLADEARVAAPVHADAPASHRVAHS